ncbi:blastomere cadherin-like [Rana temporaria]|uniref:blastomere cadherin-like n=1 Tax=Rana temporaria TaxID=8407 RepID=UPI001AAD2D06|nr:blastomere cadherin-like [Rana temporaria]
MKLGCLLLVSLIQVCHGSTEAPCEAGFTEQRYAFTVTRKVLERGRVLGKVTFDPCSSGPRALYSPDDTRFRVFPDGKVTVKRQVTLHDGSVSFVLNAWDGAGKKYSVTVSVWNEREDTPRLLKRQKRDWSIPPVVIAENDRGPFPKRVVQIRSSQSTKTKNIKYSISGGGADRPPVGVFTIDANTGFLAVTRSLDREEIDKYELEVQALSEAGAKVEEPMKFIVKVIDQNDNQPIFTQTVSEGFVTEGAPKGTSVMTIAASDLDDTKEGNNGIIRYSILQQTPKEPPNAFAIAADTGVITVTAEGLAHQRNPKFSLVIRAADKEGHGFAISRTVVIAVGKADLPEMSGVAPSLLTTHVLNIAQGTPAKGLTMTLSKFNGREAKWEQVSRSVTDQDGRCPGLLLGEPLTAGTFQLRFHTGEYWKQLNLEAFHPYVEVVFIINDPKVKYHVPLLITPHSYSTYRGS